MQPFVFQLAPGNVVNIEQRYALPHSTEIEFRFRVIGSDTFSEVTTLVQKGNLNSPLSHTLTIGVDNTSHFLQVIAVVVGGCPWLLDEAEHPVASESFKLKANDSSPYITVPTLDLKVISGNDFLALQTCNYQAKICQQTGALVSVISNTDTVELLAGPSFLPVFSRACVDNDLGGAEKYTSLKWLVPNSMVSNETKWKSAGLHLYDETYVWPRVSVEQSSSEILVIREDTNFRVHISFMFEEWEISAGCKVEYIGKYNVDSLARIGLLMETMPTFSKVKYCGRGPFENYSDRQSGAMFGVYETSVDEMHVPYIFPSENGGRCDVDWVEITDADDIGVAMKFQGQVNVSRFHISELSRALHQHDLLLKGNVEEQLGAKSCKIICDFKHMGVGGDMSWLPCVHNEFKIPAQTHDQWSFHVKLKILHNVTL